MLSPYVPSPKVERCNRHLKSSFLDREKLIKKIYKKPWLGRPLRIANRILTAVLVGKGLAYRKTGTTLEKLGTDYGGWVIPVDHIRADTVCYCGGVGEDISFDLALIERFGCSVFAFDPTPRAIVFVEKSAPPEEFHFFPWGLWNREAVLKFYEPADPAHVSHSVVNLEGTSGYFEAACKPVSAIARELGHSAIGLLKIDIEGAGFAVIRDLIEHDILPDIICVEFDQPCSPLRIRRAVRQLEQSGLELVSIDLWNYTFVK
jgi:FkbM family methyltransferase